MKEIEIKQMINMWEKKYGLGIDEVWESISGNIMYTVRRHDWDIILNGICIKTFKTQEEAAEFIKTYIKGNE